MKDTTRAEVFDDVTTTTGRGHYNEDEHYHYFVGPRSLGREDFIEITRYMMVKRIREMSLNELADEVIKSIKFDDRIGWYVDIGEWRWW